MRWRLVRASSAQCRPMRVMIWVVSCDLSPVSLGQRPPKDQHKRRHVKQRQVRPMWCVESHFDLSSSSKACVDIMERMQRHSDQCRCSRGWYGYRRHELCKLHVHGLFSWFNAFSQAFILALSKLPRLTGPWTL